MTLTAALWCVLSVLGGVAALLLADAGMMPLYLSLRRLGRWVWGGGLTLAVAVSITGFGVVACGLHTPDRAIVGLSAIMTFVGILMAVRLIASLITPLGRGRHT